VPVMSCPSAALLRSQSSSTSRIPPLPFRPCSAGSMALDTLSIFHSFTLAGMADMEYAVILFHIEYAITSFYVLHLLRLRHLPVRGMAASRRHYGQRHWWQRVQ
jgi:hypothetical protein